MARGRGFDDGAAIPPPRLRGRRGRGTRAARKPPGKITLTIGLIGILITFGVGIGGLVTSVASLPYRAGWAGTAGTASLISCEEIHSGRSSHVDCAGTFTATDGSVTPLATIEGDTALGPRDYPARLHPDGVISIVSTATVLFALAGVFGSLILVFLLGGFGTLIVVAAVRRRSSRAVLRSKWPVRIVLIATGAVAATALVLSIAGSAIGV